jgi:hypothetical protein
MALALASLSFGAVLGLSFEVLVLVPVVLLAAAIVGIDGWAHSLGFSRTILTILVSAMTLEIGYLGGAAVYALISKMEQFRASRFPSRAGKRSSPQSRPRGHGAKASG